MDAVRIAIVEDDPEIRGLLAEFLRREGFTVAVAADVAAYDALVAAGHAPQLVVLDWMLPGEDGLSLCQRIAVASGPGAGGPAVIMLTAKDDDIDRVLGLEIGADDYVTTPFSPRVLLARIRAVLRRARSGPRNPGLTRCSNAEAAGRAGLAVADLLVDLDARRVLRRADGAEVPLTSAEFDLLHCFVTRPQRVLSRDQLLDWTRGRIADVFDRTIDVQVSRLRRKLGDGGSTAGELLRTVRNAGYILAAPVRPE